VSADVASEVIAWPDLIGALKAAYSMPQTDDENPPRAVARGQGTWFRALSAILPTGTYMGAKLFGLGRQKAVSYAVVLFDQETGEIAGLLDGESLTAFRTAATSAVAMDRLLAPGDVRVGILGSGAEAHSHLRALAAIRQVGHVSVFSPSESSRHAFADTFRQELGVTCDAASSARAAVDGNNLVIAAARSRDETPIFESSWLPDGTCVVSVGSTLPDQREIETALVARADVIIADMPQEVMEGTGDFIAAQREGIDFEHKIVSLNDMMRGVADERLRSARLPLFKSVGAALQDLVVAELALRKAKERGLAQQLPAFALKKGKRPKK
jgi:ornithine cyclodeaminase/alanine dehydrogenase